MGVSYGACAVAGSRQPWSELRRLRGGRPPPGIVRDVSSDGPHRHQPVARSAVQALASSTVDFLAGDWTLIRRICDHRSGQIGTFTGTASFRPPAEPETRGILEYCESGELRLGRHRGPASRSLLVRDSGDGTADITFADGREFYRLDLRYGSCVAAHPCRADQYDVTVRRLSANSYTEIWRVTGPAKDYELHTTYSRVCQPALHSAQGTGGSP
jgi:Family of unknown function (DUF6314)